MNTAKTTGIYWMSIEMSACWIQNKKTSPLYQYYQHQHRIRAIKLQVVKRVGDCSGEGLVCFVFYSVPGFCCQPQSEAGHETLLTCAMKQHGHYNYTMFSQNWSSSFFILSLILFTTIVTIVYLKSITLIWQPLGLNTQKRATKRI